jgi:hypothetical protein
MKTKIGRVIYLISLLVILLGIVFLGDRLFGGFESHLISTLVPIYIEQQNCKFVIQENDSLDREQANLFVQIPCIPFFYSKSIKF